MPYTIRDFRVNSLPGVPIPNSRYYVPNGNGTDLNEYLTDLTGAYRLVGSAGSPSTDEKVKVSSNDTTPGFLNGKLVVGAGISFLENNNGGNETLTISHVDTSSAINLDTSGAQVIDLLTFDTFGHVQTVTTRNLTPADIGVPNAWNLLGNSGTSQSVNFLGTLDTQGIQFRTNNNIAGLIENSEPLAPGFARGTGGKSVFLGSHAGESANLNGDQHSTFIGTYAGRFAKSTANTFVGFHAGLLHTYGGAFGGRNVAFGNWAFNAGYKAYDCTALGTFALNNLFEGVSSVGVGRDAAKSLTYGNGIHAIGSYALLNNSTGISGITITNGGSGYTTATITFSAPQFTPIGGNCSITATGTAIISSGSIVGVTMTEPGCGYMKLSADEHFTELGLDSYWYATTVTITGDGVGAAATPIFVYPEGNVGLGGYSGLYDRFGFYNTYLGSNTYSSNGRWYDKYSLFAGFGAAVDTSIPSGTAIEKSVAIGYNARVGQSNSIILGGTGADQPNIGIGTITPVYGLDVNVPTDISLNSMLLKSKGTWSGSLPNLAVTPVVSDKSSMGFGVSALVQSGILSTAFGFKSQAGAGNQAHNTSFGSYALMNVGGFGNTAVGSCSLITTSSGHTNTNVGIYGSVISNSTGSCGFGAFNLYKLTTGSYNVAMGKDAGSNITTGWNNTVIGTAAMGKNGFTYPGTADGVGNNNTAIGSLSLYGCRGNFNTGIGQNSGYEITTGNYNVIIGGNTGSSIATSNNNIIISDGQGNVKLTIDSSHIFTISNGLQDFADDTAAGVGGIGINSLYRTGSIVKIRVS